MKSELRVYFENLRRLSSDELHRSVPGLIDKERRNTACVIAYLAEIDTRKLHLAFGYKIFDYCVKHLRLSEGSVWCRIQVARRSQRFP